MENPIFIDAKENYDYSVSCDKGGATDAPWMVTVKVSPHARPEVIMAEWHSPSGYASYQAGKDVGIEKALALVRELEATDSGL